MNRKDFNETEICQNFITPAIARAGWDQNTQIRREFAFTDGRVILRGKVAVHGRKKWADYLLFFQSNLPLAVIEAKDNSHPIGGGMQQALEYAETLDVPFVFSSNGDGFVFHDRTGRSTPVAGPRGRVGRSSMARSSTSLAGRRIAYLTPRRSSASYRAGRANAASARTTTACPCARCRSMTGRSTSSHPSALWTLPGRSVAARQSPCWLKTKSG
jgi:Type I restriction enzyme R protein N terminus (HSDR_N)